MRIHTHDEEQVPPLVHQDQDRLSLSRMSQRLGDGTSEATIDIFRSYRRESGLPSPITEICPRGTSLVWSCTNGFPKDRHNLIVVSCRSPDLQSTLGLCWSIGESGEIWAFRIYAGSCQQAIVQIPSLKYLNDDPGYLLVYWWRLLSTHYKKCEVQVARQNVFLKRYISKVLTGAQKPLKKRQQSCSDRSQKDVCSMFAGSLNYAFLLALL